MLETASPVHRRRPDFPLRRCSASIPLRCTHTFTALHYTRVRAVNRKIANRGAAARLLSRNVLATEDNIDTSGCTTVISKLRSAASSRRRRRETERRRNNAESAEVLIANNVASRGQCTLVGALCALRARDYCACGNERWDDAILTCITGAPAELRDR